MNRISRCWAWAFVSAVVVACTRGPTAAGAEAAAFEPQFGRATLELNGKVLAVGGVRAPWAPAHRVGADRVVVREAAIEAADAKDGRPAWEAKAPDGRKLRWLGSAGTVALLAAEPLPDGAAQAFEVRRFDVKARKWLEPLAVPTGKPGAKQFDVVVDALADGDRLAVLTQRLEPGERRDWKSVSYCLAFWTKRQATPAWVKTMASEGKRPQPGVAVFASVMPDYADSDVRTLNWLGDGVLLCAGEKEALVCFDAAGAVRWAVPRVWEFQRGFIGPSVWSHYVSRFGVQNFGGDLFKPATPDWEKELAAELKRSAVARAEFDKQFECAIVGGPIVIPGAKRPGFDGREVAHDHIMVAIAKGPNAWNWGYLSDCVAYEITEDGRLGGMVNLPRMVYGRQVAVDGDGVVWGCQKGAMARLSVNGEEGGFGMGPGGPDLLTTVDWYRQFPERKLDGWLTTGKVRDVVAFAQGRAFRAVSGGYVAAKSDPVYRFPLSIVDLRTGAETTATLNVPYKGELPLPKTNASTEKDKTHAKGPYLLGVTQMHVEGGMLEVTLGMEGTSTGVSFDVGTLVPPAAK